VKETKRAEGRATKTAHAVVVMSAATAVTETAGDKSHG
jgi:hypothetical protein